MKRHTVLRTTTAAGAALLLCAAGAGAQTWTKTGSPGNTPALAQITAGVGALTTITGSLSYTTTGTERNVVDISNPDLFAITITGTTPFMATTVGQPTTLFDPRLFLFNSAGLGVFYNDDASGFTHGAMLNPTTLLAPGVYYLGIGTYGAIPRSAATKTTAANDIFADPYDITSTGFTGLLGATGPGSALPLASWFLSGADVETGSYTIALSGATFAAAPEPSQAVSLAVGLLGLGACGLRARRRGRASASLPRR